MDPEIWVKSMRSSLFYKFTLNHVFLLCVVNVILYIVAPFGKQLVIDMHFLVVLMTTFILSLVAYFTTDIFIDQMKTKLC
jgi:hypothetical protein